MQSFSVNAFICQDDLRFLRLLCVEVQRFSENAIILLLLSRFSLFRGMRIWPPAAGRRDVDFELIFKRLGGGNFLKMQSCFFKMRWSFFAFFCQSRWHASTSDCSIGIHYDVTRLRPALPALAQTQPPPCSRLCLCCVVSSCHENRLKFRIRNSRTALHYSFSFWMIQPETVPSQLRRLQHSGK